MTRSGRGGGAVHIDSVTIALVLSIALLGLVMVTSASVSIASKDTGQTFFYLERQLVLMLIGAAIVSGADKRIEAALVDASPQWLTELTTSF